MYKVLHLTHTDIRSDSRILKEMRSIASHKDLYKVYGVGIQSSNNQTSDIRQDEVDIELVTVALYSRRLSMLPKFMRHMLSFIEVFMQMMIYGIKIRPDVIHCHDNLILPIGVALKLLTRSKLIYDAHELESDKNGLSKVAKKLILSEEKILWRFIDSLIVVSPSIDQWYQDNLGKKESEIILNAPILVDKSVNRAHNDYFRSHFSIPDNERIFLYIGGLCEGRGLDLIIDAFTSGEHNSHVVFLGYGEKFDDLKVLSVQYANIHVHQAVPHHQVVELARSADVGLCLIQNISLSDYYCLPNKLFEYAFSGIPVLASKFPDISFVVDKYKLGRCCDLTVEAVVDAVIEFQNTEISHVDVKKLYDLSWHAQEEKLRVFYAALMEGVQ